METDVTDKDAILFRGAQSSGSLREELDQLTIRDLEFVAKRLIENELCLYFSTQEPELVDQICHWVVDAPREEWLIRLVFIECRGNRHGCWDDNWSELYYKVIRNKPEDDDIRAARCIRKAVERAIKGDGYIWAMIQEARRPDSMPKSQPSTWRRILRFLSLE